MHHAPPIFSRILLVISSLLMVAVVYVFISRALEPAPIVSPSPMKQAETFNAKADVSKNPAWKKLQATFMEPVPDMPIGRSNPFETLVNETPTAAPVGNTVPRSELRIAPVPKELQSTSTNI